MNEDLQPTARKIQKAQANQSGAVPLDQPHPEALATPSPTPPPEPDPTQTEREEKSPEEAKQEDKPSQILEPEDSDEKEPPTIAGYKPEDLLTAPLKPPEPVKTENRRATRNGSVVLLVGIGIVLLIIGILFMVLGLVVLGLIVALLGACAVVASVFIPFKK